MDRDRIKKILSLYGTEAKKSLGQHFLVSLSVVETMVRTAEICEDDTILEIGPGLGVLTEGLASSSAREIILCEKDRKFCEYLKGEFKNKKFKIICDDALLLIPNLQVKSPARNASGIAGAGGPFKVISNLPYNISSPVIISLLTVCPTLPDKMVVMVQREVADRFIAAPHDSNRGILTAFLELFGSVKIIEKVPKNFFYPAPEVDSAVIELKDIKPLPFSAKYALKIIKLSFSGKRKMIKNSLFSSLKIPPEKAADLAQKSGINLDMRPEELTRDQWMALIQNTADL